MSERAFLWLLDGLRRVWVSTVILSALVAVLLTGILEADWVEDEAALSYALIAGLVFGLLLARSRFPGWFAAAYGLVISALIAVESVGRVLPPAWSLVTRPPAEVLEQMNLRIVNVALRMGGWMDTLRAGDNVEDPGMFIVLMGALLSLCGIWLMWSFLRRRSALIGVLPIGVLFAINMHLSRQPLLGFMAFLFCVLLLIARSEYSRQHEEWQHRQVDYPDHLGLEWGAVAMACALVVVLIARAAPLLGTPEGWRAISEWVNRANDQTSETATRLFSGVNPPPPDPNRKKEVFVNTPDLGTIGAPIAQGLETIMWVSTSDPPPLPREAGLSVPSSPIRVHYWRNGIYGEYNGRGWEPAPPGEQIDRQAEDLPPSPPPGRYYLRQNFELEARHQGTLFATSDPVQTSSDVYLREVGAQEGYLVEGQASEYAVISAATRVSATQLANAPVDYPPEIRARYLQVPDTLPQRVRTLAGRVVAGAENQYQRVLRVQNYLRENYEYDLTVGEAPPGRDVVDYFLFEDPRGFCSHYASAMAVMLRSVGVPARVVTGYAMGEFDQERQAFQVQESAAHAWVEVYFPPYGWIEFEPTIVRSAIVYVEEDPVLPGGEPVVSLEEEPPAAGPFFAALVLLAALALIVLPFLLLRVFGPSRQPPVVQASTLYRRMRRALGWAGLDAVGSVTPDEYLRLYNDRLSPYGQLQMALNQATALYREAVYSAHQPDANRVRSASRLWQSSFRQWLALWLRAAWARLRSRLAG